MAATEGVVAGSFRDPAGFVFRRNGDLFRQVNDVYAADYRALIDSGLAESLVQQGLLIPHEEVEVEPAAPGAHVILRPREVSFISYPYEWSFSQLRDAALATLEIQRIALEHEMSLRDASAYNIQLDRGRPVLIDTLSFERRKTGPWVAYRQFCSHFVAPLALMAIRDPRLGLLLRDHIDGVPLDMAAALLPARARLRPLVAIHVIAHARSQRKHGGEGDQMSRRAARFGEASLRGLLESLRSGIQGLTAPEGTSVWRDYYDQATHYTDDAARSKEGIVGDLIDEVGPASIWDLGSNTGRFSRLGSTRGIDTVAFDMDPRAVDAAYLAARATDDQHLLPLVLDLSNPSPGIGWANAERMTLAERGPADLVLALALVHHLAIGNNVPFPMIADYLATLGRHVAVEFVPKDDERVRQLLTSRVDIFDAYTTPGFEGAVDAHFEVVRREPLAGSSRVVYLLRAR